ncbi:MAG: glycoside hydrolase family 9 protein [Kiritimatiellae bacterium]|nr:glycoside hydrolase family 9 protein [Kiritimatiellia bacterium]
MKTIVAFFVCVAVTVALGGAGDPEPAAERPGIDLPDFQRLYLSRPEPAVRFKDDMEDASGWRIFCSEGSTAEVSRVEGPGGDSLHVRYDLKGPGGFCSLQKEATPFTLSGRCGIAVRLRSTNPLHVIDMKLVDADGGYFGRLGISDPNLADLKELVVRPDDVAFLWGGENTRLDEVRYYEVGVAASGTGGAGELVVDEYRITDHRESYVELALSQVGYHPEDAKRCVVRHLGEGAVDPAYDITDAAGGRTVLTGRLEPSDFHIWSGQYYVGDFSALAAPGKYRLRIHAGGKTLESSVFEVGRDVLNEEVTPAVISFLRFMHCGLKCHPRDPIVGGYHDTFYDIGNRMWSLTHMIVGLAMSVERGGVGDWDRNRLDEALDELLYALSFALQAQLPDGGVGHFGIGHDVKPGEEVDNSKFPFEEDTHPRILDTEADIVPTYYYVGAMCRAYPVIREEFPAVAAEVMKAARRAADFLRGREKGFSTSFEHGGFIYAMTEMYRLTGESSYLDRVPHHLERAAAMQDLDSGNKGIPICGDFYLSARERAFAYQYKFHEVNLAILLGVANIVELYEPSSPEWLRAAYLIEVFHQCYLKPMSSLTPYRQIAHGVEREGAGYRVALFSPPDQPWISAHGLNVDHFAYGYLAMRMAWLFEDPWCETFADDQMQWVLGANPLRYCMVCGVGANNPVVWSSMHGKAGPVDGGIPNGLVGDRLPFPIWLPVFSSGEYWLPHNDWYLILSAVLDRSGSLAGICPSTLDPRPSGRMVSVYDGDVVVQTAELDDQGRFGPVELAPQREYRVRYEGEDGWAEKKVLLLAGEHEEVLLDPSASYDIRLACLEKNGDRAIVEIAVQNTCGRDVTANLVVRVFDGNVGVEQPTEVVVPAGEVVSLEREFAFGGERPLLVAVGREALLIPYR